jgi:glycosyltransferase involved in cell wall biosynthesis
VHLNGYAHGALPWGRPVVMVGHSCVASWWRAVRRAELPDEWARYREEVRAGLNAADEVVAPTRTMGDALVAHYELERPVRVIHNARRAGVFRVGVKEPFVFSAGRLWDDAKNVGALDRVATRLRWPVRIAGDTRGPGGESQSFVHARSLGTLDQRGVAEQFARASIYALPARYEPFGLSILEPALSGCALVLGDIPSLRELWDDAAVFVDPFDDDALGDALQALIAHEQRRHALAGAAMLRARRFTLERMGREYAAVYGRLATRRRISDAVLVS